VGSAPANLLKNSDVLRVACVGKLLQLQQMYQLIKFNRLFSTDLFIICTLKDCTLITAQILTNAMNPDYKK
jgi:hypothetical protein